MHRINAIGSGPGTLLGQARESRCFRSRLEPVGRCRSCMFPVYRFLTGSFAVNDGILWSSPVGPSLPRVLVLNDIASRFG